MSISRVPIGSASGTANNQFHGQGQFCYYRKGSAVSGVTDVAVYVDSAYMGLMSPTEHFSLNTKGTFWEFKPVDPLLVGEFVLADTAEEYGSSAVAGAVSITSLPDNSISRSDAGNAYFSGVSNTGVSPSIFLTNLLSSTKSLYLEKIRCTVTGAITSFYLDIRSYTGGSWGMAGGNDFWQPTNKKTLARDSGSRVSYNATGVTGSNDEARIVELGVGTTGVDLKFDSPIILPPGIGVALTITSAGSVNCSLESQFFTK